jgi:HD-like signal output (HDOD) protein
MNWFLNWLNKKSPSSTRKVLYKANQTATASNQNATSKIIPALAECAQNLSPEQLKQFVPLRSLDDNTLSSLIHSTLIYPKDIIIFEYGQASDCVYYLLEGEVSMQPDSDSHYDVKAGSSLAALPLNSGQTFGATCTSLTDVTLLKTPEDINRLWTQYSEEQFSCVEVLDFELPTEIANHHFFNSFAQAYRENKLKLPSLPNVAFRLKDAMQRDIGIDEAVDILHMDTAIVAKLIQVANSPLYTSTTPIKNCHDAVIRIGLTATRNLVLGISLKQLFNAKDKTLVQGMRKLWQNSLYVSSLSFVLAQECSTINPEDALLAGLICDIGAIPLLHFAEQFPEQYPSLTELEESLTFLRGPVGSLVLHTLGFPSELTNIPNHAENWLYDSSNELTLADIVILAKLHSYVGTKSTNQLPYINSVPAYAKINQGKLDPDFSLQVLHKAKNRIYAAMQLLS